MTYSAAAILALASQCAPSVAPETVLAIIQAESSGEPFALNVNGGRQPARQSSAVEAAATAQRYIAAGYSVDLGLGQINSRNMPPEASRVFRRLLSVRRSYDDDKEQVFA